MTSILPPIITGEVVPGVIDPSITRSHFTNLPYGPPIQPARVESVPMPLPGTKPRPTGDERHSGGDMMQILQKVLQQQQQGQGGGQQAPIAKSLPGFRDWRG